MIIRTNKNISLYLMMRDRDSGSIHPLSVSAVCDLINANDGLHLYMCSFWGFEIESFRLYEDCGRIAVAWKHWHKPEQFMLFKYETIAEIKKCLPRAVVALIDYADTILLEL